jgi:hypothetical protein
MLGYWLFIAIFLTGIYLIQNNSWHLRTYWSKYLSVYCVPGKFENTTSNQCEFCPKKTYKPTTGNEACTDCISNKTTSGIGSISDSDCSVGLYQYV